MTRQDLLCRVVRVALQVIPDVEVNGMAVTDLWDQEGQKRLISCTWSPY
jgi:hypothetical protein